MKCVGKLPYTGEHLRGKLSHFEWKIPICGKICCRSSEREFWWWASAQIYMASGLKRSLKPNFQKEAS